jgi:hypothetical protein
MSTILSFFLQRLLALILIAAAHIGRPANQNNLVERFSQDPAVPRLTPFVPNSLAAAIVALLTLPGAVYSLFCQPVSSFR